MGRAFPLGDPRQEWEVVEVGRMHGATKTYLTQWPVLHMLAEIEGGVFLGDLLTPPSKTMARVVVRHGQPVGAILFEDVGLTHTIYLHIVVRKSGFNMPPGILESAVTRPYEQILTYRASVPWKKKAVLRMAHRLGFRIIPYQAVSGYVDLEVPYKEFIAAVLDKGFWCPRSAEQTESPRGSAATSVVPSRGGSR